MLGWWCHLATWNLKVILVFNYALKWCIVCVSGIIGTSSNCMLNDGTVNFLIYRLKGPHTATLAGSQRCFFCLTSGFFLVLGEMQPFLLVYGTCMWHHWNYFGLAVEDMGAGFFSVFYPPRTLVFDRFRVLDPKRETINPIIQYCDISGLQNIKVPMAWALTWDYA